MMMFLFLNYKRKHIFDDDFINEITALDGVTGVKRWYSIDAVCNVNGSRVKNVQGYTKDEGFGVRS